MDIFYSTGPLSFQENIAQKITSLVAELADVHFDSDQFALRELLAVLQSTPSFPVILSVNHPCIQLRIHVIRCYDMLGDLHLNACLDLSMPAGESLLWMPWLPHQIKPSRTPGHFHHVNFGRWAVMPRRSRCFDHTYSFSGQRHPVEAFTPPEITNLYAETNRLFHYEEPGVNMCLENDYNHGRNYIFEHSDNERQFGKLHDVVCWVTGPASRPLEIRVRRDKSLKAVPPHLIHLCADPSQADKTRSLLRIQLPEGLYVMQGRSFQEHYSHEFPELHSKLFPRLVKAAAKEWPTGPGIGKFDLHFPVETTASSKGVSMLAHVQADWLKANSSEVEALILRGRLTKTRGQTPEKDLANFRDWCLERTSYTLRSFVSE